MYEASQYASGKYFPLRVPGAPSTGLCERGVAPSTRAPELVNMCYIEDQDYCGVKLHLAACPRLVGRWDDGGLGCRTTAPMLCAVCRRRCCCCCWFCFYLCLCLLARVGVLGNRRGPALGHPCGMPPTGANIAVLLLKTWLAPDSTYT